MSQEPTRQTGDHPMIFAVLVLVSVAAFAAGNIAGGILCALIAVWLVIR